MQRLITNQEKNPDNLQLFQQSKKPYTLIAVTRACSLFFIPFLFFLIVYFNYQPFGESVLKPLKLPHGESILRPCDKYTQNSKSLHYLYFQ